MKILEISKRFFAIRAEMKKLERVLAHGGDSCPEAKGILKRIEEAAGGKE